MKQDFIISSWLFILMVIVIIFYSLIIYAIGHKLWPSEAKGNLIHDKNGMVRGSFLLGQSYTSERYFYGRPQLIFKDQCNVALYNEEFWNKLLSPAVKNQSMGSDIIMSVPSNSMLDPYITKNEAMNQAPKIALARKLPLQTLKNIINTYNIKASTPFFVLDIVNVTILNSKLDNY